MRFISAEALKAAVAQLAMFRDPSHAGKLHEETVQTAKGPAKRWVSGGDAGSGPAWKKDANDKRTFELDTLIGIHKQARDLPRHHLYQWALSRWGHDEDVRDAYKRAMPEQEEGPAHQRLRLLWAKGAVREATKGMPESVTAEALEALKALAPEVGAPPARNRQEHPFVGTIRIPGLPLIRVETAQGETRSGVDPDGKPWSVTMPAHYGEFHGTLGVDDDPVDVFVGPDVHAPFAYVFHMTRLGQGGYDEWKTAVGFANRDEAERCLRDAYNRPGLFFSPPHKASIAELAHWLAEPANRGRIFDGGAEMTKAVHRDLEGYTLEEVERRDGFVQGYWKKPGGPVEAGPSGGGGGTPRVVNGDVIKAEIGTAYRPPHGATVAVQPDVLAFAERLLPGAAPEQIAGLAGATTGDLAEIKYEPMDHALQIDVVSPDVGWQAIRQVSRERDGAIVLNAYIHIDPEKRNGGLGTQLIASAVVNAAQLGIGRIDSICARTSASYGYYIWPRRGFFPLDRREPVLRALAAPAARDALLALGVDPDRPPDLGALVRDERLAAWWKEHGVEFRGQFDLRPGSLSFQTLAWYLDNHARR